MGLVGRETEVAELLTRVRESRLITVTGPGGIGKTAIAQHVAERAAPEFEYGAIHVDLTRVDHEEAVSEAVAGQLGYADFSSLVNSRGDQPTLVVLDNCEHVLTAAADVITQLLDACEMPTVLATSRSPLDLPDESILLLGPLRGDPIDGQEPPSVVLLLDMVRRFGGDAEAITPDDAADICAKLDHVPLAIELAAARLRSMSVGELRQQLEVDPAGLGRRRYRGSRPHRTVREVVEWSVVLLDADEREAFDRLGVMAGPFTAPMAAAVIDIESADDLLDRLVEASLIVADTSGPVTWFRMLHPVRAVAAQRLGEDGNARGVESRLVDHVVQMATDTISAAANGWDSELLPALLALYDNLVAATRWCLRNDDAPDRANLLVAVMWGIVHQAHTEEIGEVGAAVLERWDDPAAPFWPDAVATVATCRNLLGDPAGAIALAGAALPQCAGSPFAPATLRRVLAQAHRAIGRPEEARALFAAGAEAGIAGGATGIAMELRVDQALLTAESGDLPAALALIDEVLADARRADADVNLAWAAAGRGAAIATTDPAAARPVLIRALDHARRIRYPAGISFSLKALADVEHHLGDDRAAAEHLLELGDELLCRGGLVDLRMMLDVAALVLRSEGRACWDDLAVTADSLPITSVGTPVRSSCCDDARPTGQVLGLRDAFTVCRTELRAVADGPTTAAAPDAEPHHTADGRATRAPHDTADPADPSPAGGPSLQREGDTWRLEFDTTVVTVKHSKGVADLAALLAAPRREIAAVDLQGVAVSASTGERIDETARRVYEQRIRELQTEIDEAEANHDLARHDALQDEFDALVAQLTDAVGLGGRARRHDDDAERARSAVTQRIRAAIARIGDYHPEAAAHLRSSIRTGTYCRYDPPSTTTWTVTR